jgi:MFS family permease
MSPVQERLRAAGLPGRLPFYYGWVVLVLAALAMVATLPGRTHGLGLITERLMTDLGLGRYEFASINLWATLIGASFCLPVGRLIDRLGTRTVLAAVLLCLSGVVLSMATLSNTWWSAGALFAIMLVLVTLTRGFGQSALSVVSLAVAGKWFTRRLGLAMGVYSIIVALGFMGTFATLRWILRDTGGGDWRLVWAGIGVCLLALVPVNWLLMRDTPEQCCLAPDGQAVFTPTLSATDYTLRQALCDPAFWVFVAATSLYGLISSGISLFNESILDERGFARHVYLEMLTYTSFVGMISNFLGGWLATRWRIGRLLAVSMALMASALLALPHVRVYWHVVLYATAMGLSGGVVTVVFFTVWGHAYGRAHLGRIQGVAQMGTVLASALGPLLLAWSKEETGSYTMLFYTLAPVAVVLGLAAWLVPLPSAAARQEIRNPNDNGATNDERYPQRNSGEISPITQRG